MHISGITLTHAIPKAFPNWRRHTKSVTPAKTKTPSATRKFSSTIKYPKTGAKPILAIESIFGIVQGFSYCKARKQRLQAGKANPTLAPDRTKQDKQALEAEPARKPSKFLEATCPLRRTQGRGLELLLNINSALKRRLRRPPPRDPKSPRSAANSGATPGARKQRDLRRPTG